MMDRDMMTEAPELVGIGAREISNNASRLGLTWNMETATVTQTRPLAVRIDGDDADISAASAAGSAFYPGARVYVARVPPGGIYVLGWVGYAPGDLIGRTDPGADSASVGAVETEVDTITQVYLEVGRAYRLSFSGRVDTSVASAFVMRHRLTDVTGTVLSLFQVQRAAGQQTWETLHSYIRTTQARTVTLSITLLATAGTVLLRDGYFSEVHVAPGGYDDYANATVVT